MSEELKPCPWCDHVGVYFSISEISSPLQYTAIAKCESCHAEAPEGSGVRNKIDDAKQEALEEWNNRAESNEITALRAQLEVSASALRAAIGTAKWQASTNREINALIEEKRALEKENTTMRARVAELEKDLETVQAQKK